MKTAQALLSTIKNHPGKRFCPGCGEDMTRIALVDIVYTFEPCNCEVAPYLHIVETLWHRKCFIAKHALINP